MPVRFSDLSNLTSPKAVVRMLEMLFACAAFSLVAAAGWSGAFAAFAMFTWCFSFAATLLIFLVEFTQLHNLLALSWKNLPVTLAVFAALMNLAASVTYPLLVLSVSQATDCPRAWSGLPCFYQIAATISSCLTFLAYSAEVFITKAEPSGGYMSRGPGLLKVLEVFLACVVFVTLVTVASPEFTGFWWCVGALCACALMSLVVIMMMVGECRGACPLPLAGLLLAFSALAVLLHVAVLLAWALQLSRQTVWMVKCSQMNCQRNQLLMSTVLIAVNLLAYVADLVYAIKLSCSRS